MLNLYADPSDDGGEDDSIVSEPEVAEGDGTDLLAIAVIAANQEAEPDLATIHPRDNPATIETLPNPEKEPIATIPLDDEPEVEEDSLEPPKDWSPRGPERG